MRIGVNMLHPGDAPSESLLRSVVNGAAPEAGHEWVIFTGESARNLRRNLSPGGGRISFVEPDGRFPSDLARRFFEQFRLPVLAKRAGVEVLWSPWFTAPLRGGVPRVTSIADLRHRRFPGDFRLSDRLVTGLLTGLSARASERVTVPTAFSRDEIVRFWGVDPAKVRVVPPSVEKVFSDRSFSGAFRAERLTELTCSADPYLLTVSDTDPRRDVAAAVMAFGRILERIPHRLVVVGRPGRDEPGVRAALNALPGTRRGVRIYRVDKADLAVLYQGADFFVFPSRYEGFPLPVLEAMTAGAPVLAAASGAVREVGGDGVECVPPGAVDALAASLLKGLAWPPSRRRERIRRARARAAEFSAEMTARGVLEACALAAASRRRTG